MANPTTASGTISIYAETNINAAYLLYLQHLANTPLLIRDINNAIINQPEPLDKLNAILEEFDDYYDYESHFKREMIDILKTHLQPLQIYSQFEEMMNNIPGGLELVNRLDN